MLLLRACSRAAVSAVRQGAFRAQDRVTAVRKVARGRTCFTQRIATFAAPRDAAAPLAPQFLTLVAEGNALACIARCLASAFVAARAALARLQGRIHDKTLVAGETGTPRADC